MKEHTRRAIAATMLAFVAGLSALGLAAMPSPSVPRPVHGTHTARAERPVWDGNGVWTSPVQPMCPASDAGHWGIGEMGHHHFFTVRCDVLNGEGVWETVATSQIGG